MESYKKTLKTIKTICDKKAFLDMDMYLIGGISAAINADIDLYRNNDDIDLMVNIKDLSQLVNLLETSGYDVKDKRGVLTGNFMNLEGSFIPVDHELNADTKQKDVLGIGIFLFERKEDFVIISSYCYDEREKCYGETQKVVPEELFDLMYNEEEIEYRGMYVKCQSKEYTYLSKSNGTREKDKLDKRALEKIIDDDAKKVIRRIQYLQKRIQQYNILRNKEGQIISSSKIPDFEEKVEAFVSQIILSNEGKSIEEIKKIILDNEYIRKNMEQDEDIRNIAELIRDTPFSENIQLSIKQIVHDYLYRDEFSKGRKIDSSEVGSGVIEEFAEVSEIDETQKMIALHTKEKLDEKGVTINE